MRSERSFGDVTLKSCMQLLSYGVIQIPFELHLAAAISLNMPCFKINEILEIEHKNRGYYSTMVTSEREVKRGDEKLLLPSRHWSKSLPMGRIGNSKENTLPHRPILYRSKVSARRAFLWYLCTTYGKAELWISKMLRVDEWTTLTGCKEEGKMYVILHLGGYSTPAPQTEFATMCMHNFSVYVRVSSGSNIHGRSKKKSGLPFV